MFRRVGDKFIVETGDMPKIIHTSNRGVLWSTDPDHQTPDIYYTSIDIRKEPDSFKTIWLLFWEFNGDS